MATPFVMAFDPGMTKIGVAVGQRITGSASPVTILRAVDGIPDWSQVEKLVREWQPVRFVVGLPLNMDGSESEMSLRAKKFSRRLEGRFGIPATTMDERLTTREADEHATRGERVDAIAACIILESWFRHVPE